MKRAVIQRWIPSKKGKNLVGLNERVSQREFGFIFEELIKEGGNKKNKAIKASIQYLKRR